MKATMKWQFYAVILFVGYLLSAFNVCGQQHKVFYYSKNYNLRKSGYPSNLTAYNATCFYSVEYIIRDADHLTSGLYIQCFEASEAVANTKGDQNIKRKWYKPLFADNPPAYEFKGIIAHANGVLVYGIQNDKIYGGVKTVGQFFSLNGLELGPIQTFSTYFGPTDGYKDNFILSPDGSKILWLGSNPDAKAEARKYFCSVWNSNGRMSWGHEVKFNYQSVGYYADQFAIDNNANVYFLMQHQTPYKANVSLKNENGDQVFTPRLALYEYKSRIIKEQFLDFAALQIYNLQLKITDTNAFVVATLKTEDKINPDSKYSNSGLQILDNDNIINHRWNQIGIKKYSLTPNFQSENANQWSVPDTLVHRYPNGVHFKTDNLIYTEQKLFWIWEEQKTQISALGKSFIYEDLGIIAIGTDSLQYKWTGFVLKSQIQKEGIEKISYLATPTPRYLNFTYPTGEGIATKLALSYVNLQDGKTYTRDLQFGFSDGNEPLISKSCILPGKQFILMGTGRKKVNEYSLTDIYNLP